MMKPAFANIFALLTIALALIANNDDGLVQGKLENNNLIKRLITLAIALTTLITTKVEARKLSFKILIRIMAINP